MNIEELKLVLETVKGVSDSAVWVCVVYFTKDFILSLVEYGLTAWTVVKVARVAYSIAHLFSFGGKVHNAFGFSGFIYEREVAEMMPHIEEAARKAKL